MSIPHKHIHNARRINFPTSSCQFQFIHHNHQGIWFMAAFYNTPLLGSKIIVRPEEALIVILVLILWIGAISLFFHRWGKIRMLEPYIPKFEENIHRPSCPLTTLEAVATKRMSLGHMSIQCGPAWNQTGLGIGLQAGRGNPPIVYLQSDLI